MNIPNDLQYSATHEWIKPEGDAVKIGLTDYAQQSLGDLVFINLPAVGDSVVAGESLGDVESVKAVSDIYSPVSGTVSAVNELLADTPELINQEPYEAWLIEVSDVTDKEKFLDAEAYLKVCEQEG